MTTYQCACFVLLLALMLMSPLTESLRNGDSICTEGYVMDRLCINRGTLLDSPSTRTLLEPEQHSIHCLVDVGGCVKSGFIILSDPENSGEEYGLSFALDAAGNDQAVRLAREVGSCSTCTGPGLQRKGLRVGVTGVVVDRCTNPPTIAVDVMESVTPEQVFCTTPKNVTQMEVAGEDEEGTCAPTPFTSSAGRFGVAMSLLLILCL